MGDSVRRKVCIVTGTRAEYGLLYPVMKAVQRHPSLELSILATGMHLMPEFGYTIKEIEADGFVIQASVPMYLSGDTTATTVKGLGIGIIGITQALEQIKPSIVVILGDRDEGLAAAIAGAHMYIPVCHIHGGDSTGGSCIDESIRHAITRFAHVHFPATPKHAERLIRMGEEEWRIHVVGPLGIYSMREADFTNRVELCLNLDLDAKEPILIVIQHPVTIQVGRAHEQMRETMEALVEVKKQAVVIYPNADAGGRAMIDVIKEYSNFSFIKTFKNLPYLTFNSLMKAADVIIGNSSAAIVDAPLFGLPAVNIGSRQESRERAANVFDVSHKKGEIVKAIQRILGDEELRERLQKAPNPYDVEGKGAQEIVKVLSTMDVNERLLQRNLTY
jgi:UDP-N-acetylglucosamine 2-epimerase (non-hydrolysing)/GDP/UDP-N,N'-diacetylbacillosamine 2-epimerase (hydrolysing)